MLMKTVREALKVTFLLSPHKLLESHIILQTLTIVKKNDSLNYSTGDINSSELKSLFPGLSKDAQLILREFGREQIEFLKKEIKQRHNKQKTGVAFSPFFRNAMLRHYHQLLERVKPFAPRVKWYHTKQLNGNKHFSTAPCRFSEYKPHLKFEVVKEGESLTLITLIDINGTSYRYDTFNHLHFLLESNNEFFILSYRDYQKLEWLQEDATR